MSDSGQKLVRLSQNGTNPGLFQIRFQYILLSESDLKSPGFVPFWTNLKHFGSKVGQPGWR